LYRARSVIDELELSGCSKVALNFFGVKFDPASAESTGTCDSKGSNYDANGLLKETDFVICY